MKRPQRFMFCLFLPVHLHVYWNSLACMNLIHKELCWEFCVHIYVLYVGHEYTSIDCRYMVHGILCTRGGRIAPEVKPFVPKSVQNPFAIPQWTMIALLHIMVICIKIMERVPGGICLSVSTLRTRRRSTCSSAQHVHVCAFVHVQC